MTDFVQPDYTVDTGTGYPTKIDQAIRALSERGNNTNMLLNGDWWVDQMNEGLSAYSINGGVPSSGMGTVDGWSAFNNVGAGVFSVQRGTDPDFDCPVLNLACTTADATIGASDVYALYQRVVGWECRRLKMGTASAEKISIAFDMKFSVAGTYGISLRNAALNRNYIGTVTQNVANTKERKLVQLTLDQTGTWSNGGSGVGIELAFCLAAGSTWQGTAGSWGSTQAYSTSAQANFMSSTSNTGVIGPIRMQRGLETPNLDIPCESYETAWDRCEHFFEKSYPRGTAVGTAAAPGGACVAPYAAATIASNAYYAQVRFRKVKRVTGVSIGTYPITTPTNLGRCSNMAGTDLAANSCTTNSGTISENGFFVQNTSGGTITPTNGAVQFHWTANQRLS